MKHANEKTEWNCISNPIFLKDIFPEIILQLNYFLLNNALNGGVLIKTKGQPASRADQKEIKGFPPKLQFPIFS